MCSLVWNCQMQTFFIPYKSSQIHCCNAGSGKQLLLCFHGYGESAETFGFLEKYLSADFTIVAIDLPFHGKTIWKEGLTFSPADLINIVTDIIQTSPAKNSRLYVAGYSLGGRVALHLLQLIPQK